MDKHLVPLVGRIASQSAQIACLAAFVCFTGCDKKDAPVADASASSASSAPSASAAPAGPIASSFASGAAQKSAKPNETKNFNLVTSHLDAGGSSFFYVNTEEFLTAVGKQLNSFRDVVLSSGGQSPEDAAAMRKTWDTVSRLVSDSGIDQVAGVGLSSISVTPDLNQNKLFVARVQGQDEGFLWSLFGKAPHPFPLQDLLPSTTALAASYDLDWAQMYDVVNKEIGNTDNADVRNGWAQTQAQILQATGLPLRDLLSSFGGSISFVVTLDSDKQVQIPTQPPQTIPAPNIALLLSVKNDQLFKLIAKSIPPSGPGQQTKTVDEPGLQMRVAPSPLPMPGMEYLQPTVAQWNGYLILSGSEQLVRDLMAAQKDGKGLKSTSAFAIMDGLPKEGNQFQIATASFVDLWTKLQVNMMQNRPDMTPQQAQLFQQLVGNGAMSPSAGVAAHLPDGWFAVGKGATGGARLAAPMVAIMAAVAIPAFTAARAKAQQNAASQMPPQLNRPPTAPIAPVPPTAPGRPLPPGKHTP